MCHFEVKCWPYKNRRFTLMANADSWLGPMPASWTLPPSPCAYTWLHTLQIDIVCLLTGLLVIKSKHGSQEHQSHELFQQDNKGYLLAELLLSRLISMVAHPGTSNAFTFEAIFYVKIFRIFKVEIIRFKES